MIDFGLCGKVALVTGASGNLGGAIASALAMQGASVGLFYGSDHSRARTESLARRLACLDGVRAQAVLADVRSEASVHDAIELSVSQLGEPDILVNNAGIFSVSSQEDLTEEAWDAVMDTNIKGVWRMCRLALVHLMQVRGTIVNICSINAFRPGFGGTAHYDASKGALVSYTRSLASELAPFGIRVNGVAPGLIDAPSLHEHTPDLVRRYRSRAALGRLVTTEEIASIVCFLASGASSAMTGEIMTADCGYGMR